MSWDRARLEQEFCSNRETAIELSRRYGLFQYSLESYQRRVPMSPTSFPAQAYCNLSSYQQLHNMLLPTLCGINNSAAAAAAAAAVANLNAASSSPFNGSSLSPPPYKRKQGEGLSPVTTLSRPWLRPRSPGQPLKCPLCMVSLEGSNITTHFVEEVHQLESLRTNGDWETKDALMTDVDAESNNEDYKRPRSLHDKMQPCTRWQTYQKVKQNRHHRISGTILKRIPQSFPIHETLLSPNSPPTTHHHSQAGMLRNSKKFIEERDKIEAPCQPIKPPVSKGIWTLVDDIKEDKSPTENVDVETRSNSTEEDVGEKKEHDDKVESWLASSNVDHLSSLQKEKEREQGRASE